MPPRISLASLIGMVAMIALALAGMLSGSRLWLMLTSTVTLAVLLAALLASWLFLGNDRAFWVGFALFGWTYLILVNWDWVGGQIGHDLTVIGINDCAADCELLPEVKPPRLIGFADSPREPCRDVACFHSEGGRAAASRSGKPRRLPGRFRDSGRSSSAISFQIGRTLGTLCFWRHVGRIGFARTMAQREEKRRAGEAQLRRGRQGPRTLPYDGITRSGLDSLGGLVAMSDFADRVVSLVARADYKPITLKAMRGLLDVPAVDYAEFRSSIKQLVKEGKIDLAKDKRLRRPGLRVA